MSKEYKVIYVKEDTARILDKLKLFFGSNDNTIRFLLSKYIGGINGLDEWISKELFGRKTNKNKESSDGEQNNQNRVRVIIK